MIEQLAAHVRLDIDAELVSPIRYDILQSAVHRIDGQQPHTCPKNDHPLAARQQMVNELVDHKRESKFHQARDDSTAKIKQKQSFIRPVIREKLAQQHSLSSLSVTTR